jgi:ribosomal protein L7Ae-like RNA K-turn-binding protein
MNPKLKSLLGLARRAGKIVTGDEACMKTVRSGHAKLVILAVDASENTRKKYTDKCKFYHTQLVITGDRNALGQALGRPDQVVIAVEDEGFAGSIRACMQNSEVESIE